jgi:hypothetical protein
MATRTSGVSGTIYALVVFVFLFVLSLALAILFYSQKVGVQDQLAQAEDRLEEMVTPQQARATPIWRLPMKQARRGRRSSVCSLPEMRS